MTGDCRVGYTLIGRGWATWYGWPSREPPKPTFTPNACYSTWLMVGAGLCRIENCVLVGRMSFERAAVRDSIMFAPGGLSSYGETSFENTLVMGCVRDADKVGMTSSFHAHLCTLADGVVFQGGPNSLLECIVQSVMAERRDNRVERCNVYGKDPFQRNAKPGPGCLGGAPSSAMRRASTTG